MNKLTVALLYGGYSREAMISKKSAESILKYYDKSKFVVYPIKITERDWYYVHSNQRHKIDKNNFTLKIRNKTIRFDVAFIMIHGTPGEDGKLQGYFDMLNIPYTSCNATTSAITFNKFFCNRVVSSAGARIAKSIRLLKNQTYNLNEIIDYVGLPCFVKPNNGGSSIGTSKVNKIEDFKNAIDKAFNEDNEILIEEYIKGTEVTCGILKTKNEFYAFPLTEIISKTESGFFDLEAKYKKGKSLEITPAKISENLTIEIQNLSKHLYDYLQCKGVVRFDYIISDNKIWFLEVNTVPGMTSASIIPQQAKAMGLDFTELISKIILNAID